MSGGTALDPSSLLVVVLRADGSSKQCQSQLGRTVAFAHDSYAPSTFESHWGLELRLIPILHPFHLTQ
jgi:hypothetical protein